MFFLQFIDDLSYFRIPYSGLLNVSAPGVGCIEAQREAMLIDRRYSTKGVIFALRHAHGWGDDQRTQQRIAMVVAG
jgi:hypothetical protein